MSEPLHIISLGAGVQSSTMALMASIGQILPMPVAAIFADTQAEPQEVYNWLGFITPQLKFPVLTVSKGNLEEEILKKRINTKTGVPYYSTFIPAFVISRKGRGMLRRKCTHDFKILPLVREQSRLVGKPRLNAWRKKHRAALTQIKEWKKNCGIARRSKRPLPTRPHHAWKECQDDALAIIWIGISTDESSRMKDSTVPWAVNRWPLIERGFNRRVCELWLHKHGFPKAPKSACRWCPYHDDEQWRMQKENAPAEFLKSIAFEKAFQNICSDGGAKNVPFLHDSLIPLDKVDFSKPSHEQINMFENECEGMCGL